MIRFGALLHEDQVGAALGLRREVRNVCEFNDRKLGWVSSAVVLLGFLGCPEAGVAGTPLLVSSWMSRAPAIDGQISAAEWSEAKSRDVGAGVTVWIGNDARTLYLSILDSGDLIYGSSDTFHLYFDDEGGAAPVLDDDAFGNLGCQGTPNLGEGLFGFSHDQNVVYLEHSPAACPFQALTDRMSFRSAARPEGVTYEAAIPLDGPAPLRAGAGERFSVYLRIFRNGSAVACMPDCAVLNPPEFLDLVLASGGCNSGPQDFGSGDPQVGLPLDWRNEIGGGGGVGWVQSLPPFYGDPVFCQSNDTGGAGAAACVSNFFYGSSDSGSALRMPLWLPGQTSATVRARAVLVVDVSTPIHDDRLWFNLRREDGSINPEVLWGGQDQSGTVEVPIPLAGSPVVELFFSHSTTYAGGLEGGYAQLDDVEILCGPILFADDFESGLTTHWNATAP